MSVVTRKIALLKTQEYFNKISSVSSDIKDKRSVFNFVEGIHDLGLWDSMVCWPLTSSQNAGVGNTAFSLGGLGTFDGTLVNGPTWGADGITSTGGSSTPHINTTGRNRSLYSERSILVVVKPTAYSADDSFFGTSNYGLQYGGAGGGIHMYRIGGNNNSATIQGGTFSSFQYTTATTTIPNGGFATFVSVISGGLIKAKTNSDLFQTNNNVVSPIIDTNSLKLMCNGSAETIRGLVGTMSFALDSDTGLSQSRADSIISLYKSTLGQGLGLP